MKLTAAGASDTGPRHSNQDAYFIDVDLGLVVVADGMGGHNAGEVASQMAVEAVADFIRTTQDGHITWPYPIDPDQSFTFNRIEVAMRIANRRVFDAGEREAAHAGMGTTIVVMLVEDDRIVIGHAGDSRAYLYRHGQLQQRTRDHTWVNVIQENDEDLQKHPLRHVLTNGIGMGEELSPTLFEEALEPGDRWLVCTDGVHGALSHEALQRVMAATSGVDAATEAVRCALAAGTKDNATAVVLNVE